MDYAEARKRTEDLYAKTESVHCPYFDERVYFGADGLHHFRYSDRNERPKREQVLKYQLFPLAIQVIKKSGTHQEYRREHYEERRTRIIKSVEYWAFNAIIGKNSIRIRVVVRRRGDGNLQYYSVLPDMKLKSDEDVYEHMMRLARDDITSG